MAKCLARLRLEWTIGRSRRFIDRLPDATRQVAFKRMENGFCVELAPGSPPALAALLARCCARDPGARPAMVDVLKELRRIELAGCDSWWNPRARRGV